MGETVPYLQIRSRCAVAYSLPAEPPKYPRKANIKKPTYSGGITSHAAKRIKKVCEILVMKSPEKVVLNPVTRKPTRFKLTFVTVTISSRTIVDHREAYEKGLKPLIRWLRTKSGVVDYIWKAELQARGQVHWHITTNTYIPWQWLRSAWNAIQKRNGWLNDYHAHYGHWNANSIDVHAVMKVDRIELYLAKYIAKTGATITGKVWDCSNTLAGKNYFAFVRDWDTDDAIMAAQGAGTAKAKRLDNCTIIETRNPETLIPSQFQPDFALWKK